MCQLCHHTGKFGSLSVWPTFENQQPRFSCVRQCIVYGPVKLGGPAGTMHIQSAHNDADGSSFDRHGNGNTKPVGEAHQNAGAVAGTPKLPNTPKLQSESPELRQSTKLIAKILRPCKHDSCCFAFLMQIRCCTMSGSRLSCSRAIVSIVLRCFSMCLSSICPRPKRGTKAVEPTVERVVCRQHARVRSVRPDNCGDPHQLDCATYRTYTTY
jgi:hypothetical protein